MTLAYILGGVVAGCIVGWLLGEIFEKNKLAKAKEDASRIINEAKIKSEEALRKSDLDGKELLYKLKLLVNLHNG